MSEMNTVSQLQQIQMEREISFAKKGLIWGVISGATWGLDGVVLGMALAMIPFTGGISLYAGPLIGAAMHDGFAGLWLFFYNLITGRWREYMRTLATRPGKIICLAALFGGPIAMSGYLLGINMAGACYALAITAMYPAVGALLAVVILKEKITPRVWCGILTCILGAMIVGYTPPEGEYPHFYLGLCLAFLATIGWGMEGVLSTYGMDMADPAIAIGIREATSFVVYLVGILPLAGALPLLWDVFKEQSVYYVLLAGVLGGVSYLCWYRKLRNT
jgi:drug/metabolite transporter (DMT)-like permease